MILSLLVGSLLVGRQIVDRAKIQRIIFEFDYYEKAFHQFYDTYRAVPGGLSYKSCIKHAEFQGCYCSPSGNCIGTTKCEGQASNEDWCRYYANSSASHKILPNTFSGEWCATIQLKASRYLDKSLMPGNGTTGVCDDRSQEFNVYKGNNRSSEVAIASFNPEVKVKFIGYDGRAAVDKTKNNIYYANKLKGHSGIIFFSKLTREQVYNQGKSNQYSEYLFGTTKFGVLTANLTSQLDAKIDDGRPGNGKILAIKNEYAWNPVPSKDEVDKVCYDGDYADLEHAIYGNSKDTKYGCNIIKVMEDVK